MVEAWLGSEESIVSRKPPPKMDVRVAWDQWMANGSTQAAGDFLDRVESWTDGTAAQLSRGASARSGPRPTRTEIVERLRYHLGVVAQGDKVTYVEALEQARQHVINELRPSRA